MAEHLAGSLLENALTPWLNKAVGSVSKTVQGELVNSPAVSTAMTQVKSELDTAKIVAYAFGISYALLFVFYFMPRFRTPSWGRE